MSIRNDLTKINNIKMVVFDLDGTLLNSKSDISKKSIDAILKAKEKGMKIIIASGRIYPMLQSYIKRIGVVDYVISANGASIDDVIKNKRVNYIYINKKEVQKVVEFCRKHNIECLVLKRNVSYYPKDSERLANFTNYNKLSKTYGYESMLLTEYDETFNDYDQIEKILINEKNEINMQKMVQFIESHTNLKYTKSGKLLLDVSSQGVSKEEALEVVCKLENINLKEVLTFGDYDNDIGMMKISGFSVAPTNGSKNALKAADYITLSNDDDGIAVVLNKLIEMRKI